MNEAIAWNLEAGVTPGGEADLRTLMAEMSAATQANEPGTLAYEWHISAEGPQCHIYERYRDSDAVMVHLGNFGAQFAERFLAALTPTRFTVYGTPNERVRTALTPLEPVYMARVAGFVR